MTPLIVDGSKRAKSGLAGLPYLQTVFIEYPPGPIRLIGWHLLHRLPLFCLVSDQDRTGRSFVTSPPGSARVSSSSFDVTSVLSHRNVLSGLHERTRASPWMRRARAGRRPHRPKGNPALRRGSFRRQAHEHDHDQGRHDDLLQGLGHRPGRHPLARLAAELRHVGRPDAVPGTARLPGRGPRSSRPRIPGPPVKTRSTAGTAGRAMRPQRGRYASRSSRTTRRR